MKNPFRSKTPVERRAETAERLADAEAQSEIAQQERLRLALAGEDTGPAEEAGWKLAARVRTYRDALAALDQEIAENERAEAAAAWAARSAAAEARAVAIAAEIDDIYFELAPRIERAIELAKCADVIGGTFVSKNFEGLRAVGGLRSSAAIIRDANYMDENVVERLERLQRDARVLQQS